MGQRERVIEFGCCLTARTRYAIIQKEKAKETYRRDMIRKKIAFTQAYSVLYSIKIIVAEKILQAY